MGKQNFKKRIMKNENKTGAGKPAPQQKENIMETNFNEYQAWKIKKIEALQYDKLLEAAENKSSNYTKVRANWLTAHYAVQFFAGLFPEIMKRVHI